jgi:transcriptional regulator with XRE-family HTH domain
MKYHQRVDRSAEIFPRQLRHLRLQRGLSQERLAELANLSINAISSFERGLRFPRPKSLDALARALGAEPGDFMVETSHTTSDRGALADLVSLLSRTNTETVELVLDLAKVLVARERRRVEPVATPIAAAPIAHAAIQRPREVRNHEA